jgi:hypothetical protein
MNQETYDSWKRRRGQAEAPSDFANKVMTAVLSAEKDRRRSLLTGVLLTLLSSRVGKVGICSLAGLTCAFRLLHLVALFIAH